MAANDIEEERSLVVEEEEEVVDEEQKKELVEQFNQMCADQRENVVKHCEHELKLKASQYTLKGAAGTKLEKVKLGLLVQCDVCNTILGESAFCFHCPKCKMWDVCFKCRNPTDEELEASTLSDFVAYLWTKDDLPVIMGTNESAPPLRTFIDAVCEKIPGIDRTKFHVVSRREYADLLSK